MRAIVLIPILITTILAALAVYQFSFQSNVTFHTKEKALSTKAIQLWLNSMPIKERILTLDKITSGYLLQSPMYFLHRPSKPKIVLYWNGDHNGNLWPVDAPRQWAEFASYACNAQCDFADTTSDAGEMASADAVVFYGPFAENDGPKQFIQQHGRGMYQTFWLFHHISPTELPRATPMDMFDFKMTPDLTSDVPITNAHRLWLQSFYQLHPKRTDSDVYFEYDCKANGKPPEKVNEVYAALATLLRVDSYGRCLNTRKFEGLMAEDDRAKTALMGSYKFCLVIEEQQHETYASNKFWLALASGCVPVYLGGKNVDEFLPYPTAVIRIEAFANSEQLAEHLKDLLLNPEAYDKLLQWKGGGLQGDKPKLGESNLANAQYLSFLTAPCRMCEFMKGVVGDRTQSEKMSMYEKIAKQAILHPNWIYAHDKQGLEGLFAKGDQLAYPFPPEEEEDVRTKQEIEKIRESKRRDARRKEEKMRNKD